MSKISDELREEAAIYCSAMACYYQSGETPYSVWEYGFESTASKLGVEAARCAISKMAHGYLASPVTKRWWARRAKIRAEAEALLRTGREP